MKKFTNLNSVRGILINPGTEVAQTGQQVEANVGLRVTPEMSTYIKEMAGKGYTTTQIRGMVKEKFNTPVQPSDTTVYLIKSGRYPTAIKIKDTIGVGNSVGSAVEKQTELTVEQLLCEPTEGKKVDKQPSNRVGTSLITVIEENPGKIRKYQAKEKKEMRITSSPEWKACLNQVKDTVPGSQVLSAAWDVYNSTYRGISSEVGEQVGAKAKRGKSGKTGFRGTLQKGMRGAWSAPDANMIKQALRTAMEPYKANLATAMRNLSSQVGVLTSEQQLANRKLVREARNLAGSRLKTAAEKINFNELRKIMNDFFETEAGKAVKTGLKTQYKAADIPGAYSQGARDAMSELVREALGEATRSDMAAGMRGAYPVSSYVGGQNVGQLALTKPGSIFGRVLMEVGGMGAGGLIGLFSAKTMDKALSTTMPRASGLLSAGVIYTGAYMIQTYLENTGQISDVAPSFTTELLTATRMATVVYMLSKITFGGQKLLNISSPVETQSYPYNEYNASCDAIVPDEKPLTEDQKAEILAQVQARLGYIPETVDVQIADDGSVSAIVEENEQGTPVAQFSDENEATMMGA